MLLIGTRFSRKTIFQQLYNSSKYILPKYCSSTSEKEEFRTIYKSPHTVKMAIINKLKFYQTIVSGIFVPTTAALTCVDLATTDTFIMSLSLALSGSILFYSLGFFANNWIGFIYIHKDQQSIKIAYVDKWGNRKEQLVEIKDIVPLTDMKSSVTDVAYYKMKRYSTEEQLKLNVGQAHLIDKETFNAIFSPIK